ncbi:HelD family protein [Cellulomonas bogoriensis]|uniref:ATPase AAA n=1 Tax=Cellulomonas bogoriensis 69B4 = DSM 16987 TaxID=1386082 RepID=A0A0A0C1R8_9CELL|nr:AAA family ATPase [Cellulomonas bogoriensis]KGM13309.1 ATPase AAA [Cellulomonas bogoriensis 69B4 = DSM 16987]
MTGRQDQLRQEQAAVDLRYQRLDTLRAQARERLATVRRTGPSGSPQNRSERDAFATLYEDRVAQLDAVEDRLCFGRLDLRDRSDLYIGRIGLTDAEHTSLLTDWRAPAARAFYSATSARPDGVVRRRHLLTRGRAVTGIEDEVLDLDLLGDHAVDPSALAGEGALLAAMAAGRTGRMGDIVATIQAEQDAVIRGDLAGALVVQGGPGTGKTAVALHRAAYLLYTHRRALERSGVLVLGPSRVFLRYIDQVLPSLGETGVVTATVADLLPGVTVRATDRDDVAEIKGRPVMADVVARAVRRRQRVPAAPVAVRVDGREVVVRPRDVREAIGRARRTGRPHNLARVTFVRDMLSRLAAQWVDQLGHSVPDEDRAAVIEDLRTTREIRIALNLAWMPLTPQRLVGEVLAKPHVLAEVAPELDARERALLHRPVDSPWTESDVPLLDEAAELLGEDDQAERAQADADARRRQEELDYARQVLRSSGVGQGMVSAEVLAERFAHSGPVLTTAERAAADRTWTYGHVVVDEAQELSPMAWRMVVRRCPTRSMTIVGDTAQSVRGTGRTWDEALDPVLRGSWRLAELTVNYRTPASVAQAARAVATAAGVHVGTTTSARDVPDALRTRSVGPDELHGALVREVRRAVERLDEGAGRVAVIGPAGQVEGLRAALADDDVGRLLRPEGEGTTLDARVSVLDPRAAKGLEFDVVVLVEPLEILAGSPGDLYVAMTRPTQALRVLATGGLPEGLS